MGAEFYSSDWHFWHPFVARLRGYASTEEHDEALLAAINGQARAGDAIWVLGDLAMGSAGRMFGTIGRVAADVHVILGNHDAPHPEHQGSDRELRRWAESGVFASVQVGGCRMLAGRKVMLSHFPYEGEGHRGGHSTEDRYTHWRLRDEGRVLLHGHTHDTVKTLPAPRVPRVLRGITDPPPPRRQIHVGVDAWGGRLAARSEVEQLINTEFGRADRPKVRT